ncbi:MAG: hypothetical protein CME43_15395 [Haliea sp.]|uniref:hypothetical protein n=1 Tax=Haliea sp. TaxID=1932666 RepID=UPI000C5D0B25|nr:hypothetical protein [Haliea sp.]MBM70850.1 hypothetical protein [Haliea sp.]|tara:strand:+ start:4134 stop:5057 length:924 start_codon:yes stop_codon:yes gene_type:complete
MTDISVFSNVLKDVDVDADVGEHLLPLNTFALFDPLTGPAPRAFASQLENVAMRARALIPGWNTDQVMDAADYLAFLLSSTPATGVLAGDEPAQQLPLEARESAIAQAAATWAKYDSVEGDTDASHPLNPPYWPSIFACYALAHIGLAHRCCAYAQPTPSAAPDNTVKERFIVASDPSLGAWPLHGADDLSRETVAQVAVHAFAALEAICCAEALVSSERKITCDKKKHALRAVSAKHAKTNALKKKVRALYREDPDFAESKTPMLSNQRVADIIYGHRLSDEERRVFTGKNPSGTIAKWIAEFRQE